MKITLSDFTQHGKPYEFKAGDVLSIRRSQYGLYIKIRFNCKGGYIRFTRKVGGQKIKLAGGFTVHPEDEICSINDVLESIRRLGIIDWQEHRRIPHPTSGDIEVEYVITPK